MCVMLELVILTHNYQFHYVFKFAFMVVFNYLCTFNVVTQTMIDDDDDK